MSQPGEFGLVCLRHENLAEIKTVDSRVPTMTHCTIHANSTWYEIGTESSEVAIVSKRQFLDGQVKFLSIDTSL